MTVGGEPVLFHPEGSKMCSRPYQSERPRSLICTDGATLPSRERVMLFIRHTPARRRGVRQRWIKQDSQWRPLSVMMISKFDSIEL